MNKSNEPKIRLKGFKGEWKSPTLEEVFEIRNGYTPSKNIPQYWTNGVIPWFRMEDIRENGGVLQEAIQHITPEAVKGGGLFKPYSIILATTATIGVHAMLIVDSLANQQFTNFSIRKSLQKLYNPYFVFYSFYKIDEWSINNSNVGGLLSVDIKGLLKIPFLTPSIQEQQAIASYFTSLDSQIQATNKKIDTLKRIKAASLQSMFPQEGETKPRVRFKGFEGEWKECKLNKYAKRVVRKNTNLESNMPLTISAINGLVAQSSYFNSLVASSNLTGYYLIKNGEFAYNKSTSLGYPFGAIKRLDMYSQGALSILYIVFSLNNNISSDYITHYFATSLWHKEVAIRAEEGARNHGLLNISAEDFLEIMISHPSSIQEQQAIASYFTSLDRKISLETKRLDKLKQIKAACLDMMFV